MGRSQEGKSRYLTVEVIRDGLRSFAVALRLMITVSITAWICERGGEAISQLKCTSNNPSVNICDHQSCMMQLPHCGYAVRIYMITLTPWSGISMGDLHLPFV